MSEQTNMSQSTNEPAGEPLNTLELGEEIRSKASPLVERTPILGTPFYWVNVDGTEFMAYGNVMLVKKEEMGDQSIEEYIASNMYEVIHRMIVGFYVWNEDNKE